MNKKYLITKIDNGLMPSLNIKKTSAIDSSIDFFIKLNIEPFVNSSYKNI